jgi:hypothetical protein
MTRRLGWRAWLPALAVATGMSGCGTLNVSVDVLDPDYVRQATSEATLRALYRRVTAARPGDIAATSHRRFEAFRQGLGQYTAALRALAA